MSYSNSFAFDEGSGNQMFGKCCVQELAGFASIMFLIVFCLMHQWHHIIEYLLGILDKWDWSGGGDDEETEWGCPLVKPTVSEAPTSANASDSSDSDISDSTSSSPDSDSHSDCEAEAAAEAPPDMSWKFPVVYFSGLKIIANTMRFSGTLKKIRCVVEEVWLWPNLWQGRQSHVRSEADGGLHKPSKSLCSGSCRICLLYS